MQTTISDSQLTDMIHEAGIRPSVQRVAILAYIANTRCHPTADEIYSDLAPAYPTLSRTTVYNSLNTFTEAGLLRELEIEGGTRHFDLAPQPPHSHFKCNICGCIFDMAIPSGLSGSVTPGFKIDSVDLYFKGLCPDCQHDKQTLIK